MVTGVVVTEVLVVVVIVVVKNNTSKSSKYNIHKGTGQIMFFLMYFLLFSVHALPEVHYTAGTNACTDWH